MKLNVQFYRTQTDSDIRKEFKEAGIDVDSRTFSTDGDPTADIVDLFVSHTTVQMIPYIIYLRVHCDYYKPVY